MSVSYTVIRRKPDFNEMVQGPSAHVVLHDRIYDDFTDLLTVIEFT
jgi:hypothetical protein